MDANPNQMTVPMYLRCSTCQRLYKDPKYFPGFHSGRLVNLQDLSCSMCKTRSTTMSASVAVPSYGQVGKEVKFTIATKDDNHHC